MQYTLTGYFIRNTSIFDHLWTFPISQSCGSNTKQKIMQTDQKLMLILNIWTGAKSDLIDFDCDMAVREGFNILEKYHIFKLIIFIFYETI